MTNRRTFPVANAPCSWGVIGGDTPMKPYRTMLDELVAAGYTGTELGDYGYMGRDAAELAAELEARNLTMLGGFVPVHLAHPELSDEDLEHVLSVAHLLKAVSRGPRLPRLILADADGQNPMRFEHAGRITASMGLDRDTMNRFGRHADTVAERVFSETGLSTAFHPHCAGWIETPDEIEALLDATSPERVGLVFDTAHYVFGAARTDEDGLLAAEGIRRFWGRIDTIHIKDCSAELADKARTQGWDYAKVVRDGLYCELGHGSIDFGAVLLALEELGYQDWLTVEQDVFPDMGTPLESATRNREFLATLGI